MCAVSRTDVGPTTDRGANRWVILVCAVLVQLAIGSVYAWSVFAKALQSDQAFGWSKSEAAVPFSVVIGMIFIGTYVGGRLQDARGPRVVAMTGGVIYAVGVILASFAQSPDSLWLLVLGYGVIGGFGLGMVYIVPIAMLQKWFPDKPGLITGLAVAGFGFGAVITAPVGQALIDQSPSVPTKAFLWLGIGYLVILLLCTSAFRNPAVVPDVTGAASTGAAQAPVEGATSRDFTQGEALHTKQWYLLTAILTMSVTAGISLIAVAAGTATDVAGYSAAAAAALVGALGLFNGAGRIFWGWISDLVGKMPAFLGILGIQGVCLLLIPHAGNAVLFAVLSALVYLCYGGAFGTMPSTAGAFFGVRNVGAIYGLMLIGWSIGGVVGPLLIASLIGSEKAYTLGFTVIGVITLVALILPLITKPPRHEIAEASGVRARGGATRSATGPAGSSGGARR
jgi:MFS transporter, OFA family, oxalate/formate antiporter